jgi:hypothetical protein
MVAHRDWRASCVFVQRNDNAGGRTNVWSAPVDFRKPVSAAEVREEIRNALRYRLDFGSPLFDHRDLVSL